MAIKEHLMSKWPKYWLFFIMFFGFLIIFYTYGDYGITWDESVQSKYGELSLEYFYSGFKDVKCNSFRDLKYYGPLFEMVTAQIYRFTGEHKYEIRHICIAILALFTIAGVMKFSDLFHDPFIVFFSSIAICMFPRFYGHAFFNSKDIPFACFFVWSMYAIVSLFHKKLFPYRQIIYTGIAIGLTLSIRVGGFLLFFYLIISAFIFAFLSKKISFVNIRAIFHKTNVFKGVSIVCIAWIVMVIFWPWAHERIIINPFLAFKMSTAFHESYPLLFEGRVIYSNQLPWYYLPKYILITTPPVMLILFIIGIGRSIYEQFNNPHSMHSFLFYTVQLWFFFPIVYFIIKRPNVYDGIRHFLFIIPAMAILIGTGSAYVFNKCSLILNKKLVFLALAVLLLIPVKDLIHLHPYQMTYFNILTGGLNGAYGRYDTEYWTSSYKEAIEWINKNINPEGKSINVLIGGDSLNLISAKYYSMPNIRIFKTLRSNIKGSLPQHIDYYVATTRWGLHRNFPEAPVVHLIGRDEAVFTLIKSQN